MVDVRPVLSVLQPPSVYVPVLTYLRVSMKYVVVRASVVHCRMYKLSLSLHYAQAQK